MARPRKDIDPDQVVKLGRLGCTQEEIADVLGVSARTIRRRYGRAFTRARAEARSSLRRAQYHRAIKCKSDKMLIWLGRVELGQRCGPAGGGNLSEVLDELLG